MKQKLLMTASSWEHIYNFHLPYLREFRRLGWEVHVGCTYGPASHPDIDRLIEMPFRKNMTSQENLQALNTLRECIRAERYDLIITHTTLAAFFTRLAVKGMKERPRVVDVMHGYLFSDNTPAIKWRVYLEAERFLTRETDLLITMNNWDYAIARRYQLGKQIIKIPGMGVDFARLDAAKQLDRITLRTKHGLPEEAFVLIYAAEFSDRKSQPVLIEALRELPGNVMMLLCGDGVTRQDCIQQAERLKLTDRILFPGYIEDIGPWYRMANAAVTASRSEGLPFNVIEAMYMGLPVVASDVKGHRDLIATGYTGLLYPYGNAEKCAARVNALLERPALSQSVSANATAAIGQYSLEKILPVIMEYYLDERESD